MGAIVTFDYNAWITLFPEFTNVTESAAAGYFTMATAAWRNDGTSPVNDPVFQSLLLNLLMANFAWIFSPQLNGQPNTSGNTPSSPLVGRINTATEGSVSVGTELELPKGIPQIYAQTKYGLQFWLLTAQFRTFRYRRAPRSAFGFGLSPFQTIVLRP